VLSLSSSVLNFCTATRFKFQFFYWKFRFQLWKSSVDVGEPPLLWHLDLTAIEDSDRMQRYSLNYKIFRVSITRVRPQISIKNGVRYRVCALWPRSTQAVIDTDVMCDQCRLAAVHLRNWSTLSATFRRHLSTTMDNKVRYTWSSLMLANLSS